ncbi:MAG: hypothetical protein ABW252_15595 [Polyangiales bacterium]
MTSTFRCLSLLGCLLSVACSERAAPRDDKPLAAKVAPSVTPKAAPDLTSTLPLKAAPLTALPAPLPEPVKPALPDDADPPHDEPVLVTDVAYDRPLDPAEVKVERFVLATSVENREPKGESEVFYTDTDKIFAFVHLANDKEPYSVKVHWEQADGPPSPYGVALTVPTASRHRTWAFTRIKRAPGRYHAVLRTLAGEEIARREFLVEASD